MDFLPKQGRLQKQLTRKPKNTIPISETIQSIEVSLLPDGQIAEGDEYISAEKEKVLDALRTRYGDIDPASIQWVMVKKRRAPDS